MANYRGHMEKFERYDMGTMRIMEVNFGATIGYLHDPNKVNLAIILRALSEDSSEVRKWVD